MPRGEGMDAPREAGQDDHRPVGEGHRQHREREQQRARARRSFGEGEQHRDRREQEAHGQGPGVAEKDPRFGVVAREERAESAGEADQDRGDEELPAGGGEGEEMQRGDEAHPPGEAVHVVDEVGRVGDEDHEYHGQDGVEPGAGQVGGDLDAEGDQARGAGHLHDEPQARREPAAVVEVADDEQDSRAEEDPEELPGLAHHARSVNGELRGQPDAGRRQEQAPERGQGHGEEHRDAPAVGRGRAVVLPPPGLIDQAAAARRPLHAGESDRGDGGRHRKEQQSDERQHSALSEGRAEAAKDVARALRLPHRLMGVPAQLHGDDAGEARFPEGADEGREVEVSLAEGKMMVYAAPHVLDGDAGEVVPLAEHDVVGRTFTGHQKVTTVQAEAEARGLAEAPPKLVEAGDGLDPHAGLGLESDGHAAPLRFLDQVAEGALEPLPGLRLGEIGIAASRPGGDAGRSQIGGDGQGTPQEVLAPLGVAPRQQARLMLAPRIEEVARPGLDDAFEIQLVEQSGGG